MPYKNRWSPGCGPGVMLAQHPHAQPQSVMTMQETQVPSPGWEEPLEKEMATHSSILAWRMPMDRGVW